jgi:hypothetical protein
MAEVFVTELIPLVRNLPANKCPFDGDVLDEISNYSFDACLHNVEGCNVSSIYVHYHEPPRPDFKFPDLPTDEAEALWKVIQALHELAMSIYELSDADV